MGDVSYPRHRALDEFDTAFGFSEVAQIGVHHGAVSGIAACPDGSKLMVTDPARDSVSWIDTGTFAHTRILFGIPEPFAIAIAGTRAYVSSASAAYDSIVAIDTNNGQVVGVHPVAHSVRDLAVSPDGRHVYACRTAVRGADVVVVDTTTGHVDAIDLGTGATTACVRVSADGARLYVAVDGPSGAELAVIDTRRQRMAGAVPISSPIRDVALSPHGDTAYVLSCGPDFSAVLDVVDAGTNMVTCTGKIAEVSGLVTGLTLSRDGERAYLVGDESVVVLSTQSHDVIGAISVGGQPSCVIESPDGNYLYIADYAGTVRVAAIASTAVSEEDFRELLRLEPAAT